MSAGFGQAAESADNTGDDIMKKRCFDLRISGFHCSPTVYYLSRQSANHLFLSDISVFEVC